MGFITNKPPFGEYFVVFAAILNKSKVGCVSIRSYLQSTPSLILRMFIEQPKMYEFNETNACPFSLGAEKIVQLPSRAIASRKLT